MQDENAVRSTILKRDPKGVVRNGAEWLALWSDPETMKTGSERRAAQDESRLRTQVAAQLCAAMRSLSGDPGLKVELTEGDRETPQGTSINVADLDESRLPVHRGRLDCAALFRRFHNPALTPKSTGETAEGLIILLEQLRCEALGAERFPGIEANILAMQYDRLARSDLLGAHLASLIPLPEALRIVVGDALSDRTDISVATSGFRMWRRWLDERLGEEIANLREMRDDQIAFHAASLRFAAALYAALGGAGEGTKRRALIKRSDSKGSDQSGDDGAGPDASEGGTDQFAPGTEALETADFATPYLIRQHEEPDRAPPYRAFTSAHDRVVEASDLADQQTLRRLRQRLDEKRGDYRRNLAQLVTQLQRRLMALQTRNWIFDLEEGLIDASRLDRVIVNPGFADAYKQEAESPFRDTCVTLLIDNSGSMRGKAIELAAVAADLIAAALEQCQVATEVLGFTTAGWRGGQSAKDWALAGSPVDPGRLNDLCHIIYKGADEPLRRARLKLCAMLQPDLLKENVDGEALLWAARRLAQRPEARRILIVISDGAPVDEATLNANSDRRILDRHLRQVIEEIERRGEIELAAIGIKHEVGDYYRAARRLDRSEELGPALVSILDALLTR